MKQTIKDNKVGIAVGVGAVAGISYLLINSNSRNKMKDTTKNAKNTAGEYVNEIKQDPKGKKNEYVSKVKSVVENAQNALNKVQYVLDNQGKDIKSTTEDIVDHTKDIAATAADAKDELKDAGDDMKKAKEELKHSSTDTNGEASKKTKETDHHVINDAIE
ncbi:hypothetical protein GLV94_09255 [Virgibacillus halodenitrificans]|uniref:hypothetical protein n=1 Tax=Virgibacillus halodenitrificans TaxID=1482 RepID=UPI000761742D|nr:hypothetical protein [Virgibacillus halodenitrificans]MYL45834.1 hypothetical protein [Virgibacillus halodenitrificans]